MSIFSETTNKILYVICHQPNCLRFFLAEMKKYIIEASLEYGLLFSPHELDVFIGILIVTTFNVRTSERDYWSTNPLLECPIVRSAMSRNRFPEIKSGLKCSKRADENKKDPAWRVRAILEMFSSNIKSFGFFETAFTADEMMIKFYVYDSKNLFEINQFALV